MSQGGTPSKDCGERVNDGEEEEKIIEVPQARGMPRVAEEKPETEPEREERNRGG